MERELLRKVQLTQLEIAKEIRRVCEENDIPYFLTCGTLLGAVRHQGFIPWDDDMDVGMLRENYEKFCLPLPPEKLKPEYCWQSWYTDRNYALPFGKDAQARHAVLGGQVPQIRRKRLLCGHFPLRRRVPGCRRTAGNGGAFAENLPDKADEIPLSALAGE